MDIEELRACGYWGEREGLAAVELWRRSGQPLATWARAVGLARTRLDRWVRRAGARPRSSAMTLASVTVVSSPSRGALTIELRTGRAVRIEGDFDDAVLARVIAVAERV